MRKYIIGALCGFLLAISISAYAEEAKTDVKSMVGKAVSGSFPVTVNGIKLKEIAVVIDDVGYLPTRAIAEAIGVEINFDSDLGILIGSDAVNKTGAGSLTTSDDQAEIARQKRATHQEELRQLKIKEIETRVERLKRGISLYESDLKNAKSPEEKVYTEDLISKAKQEIADLERQKADLESSK